ncbi:MAG: hypothetical protein Kow0029_02570 [Candidatus Rifleibacteriota bacterium]
MSKLPGYMIKRMIFMFCVMFPTLLYAEYTGNNSVILAGLAGGLSSGVSVILFPNDEAQEKDKVNKNSSEQDKDL